MKRNIFQKQDDSEITGPVEKIQAQENDVELKNNSNTHVDSVSGLTDVINLVNINQVYSESSPPNVVFSDFSLDIKDIKDRTIYNSDGEIGLWKIHSAQIHLRIAGTNFRRSIYLREKTYQQRQDSNGFSTIYFI